MNLVINHPKIIINNQETSMVQTIILALKLYGPQILEPFSIFIYLTAIFIVQGLLKNRKDSISGFWNGVLFLKNKIYNYKS